jgi:PEP-CTERM motif
MDVPRFIASSQGFDALATSFDDGSPFTFTIVSGAVLPEPSSWAMMALGFAGVGYAGYRTARQAAVAGA